ncbi:MAG TPA: hypothetical protein VFU43_03480 [Streptosporangiaceae bacterium]|nr:hypothetical protein [Streptosporangiaceae bacterium]
MILILTATAAVFMAGLVIGVLAMVVIGIHAEQHRSPRIAAQPTTRIGAASRRLRLLHVQAADAADPVDADRDQVRR